MKDWRYILGDEPQCGAIEHHWDIHGAMRECSRSKFPGEFGPSICQHYKRGGICAAPEAKPEDAHQLMTAERYRVQYGCPDCSGTGTEVFAKRVDRGADHRPTPAYVEKVRATCRKCKGSGALQEA